MHKSHSNDYNPKLTCNCLLSIHQVQAYIDANFVKEFNDPIKNMHFNCICSLFTKSIILYITRICFNAIKFKCFLKLPIIYVLIRCWLGTLVALIVDKLTSPTAICTVDSTFINVVIAKLTANYFIGLFDSAVFMRVVIHLYHNQNRRQKILIVHLYFTDLLHHRLMMADGGLSEI